MKTKKLIILFIFFIQLSLFSSQRELKTPFILKPLENSEYEMVVKPVKNKNFSISKKGTLSIPKGNYLISSNLLLTGDALPTFLYSYGAFQFIDHKTLREVGTIINFDGSTLIQINKKTKVSTQIYFSNFNKTPSPPSFNLIPLNGILTLRKIKKDSL